MATITVQVGTVSTTNSGRVQDSRREVSFDGEELASRTQYDDGRGGDSRGVTETLYKVDDGRLIVHVGEWSHWRGEPSTYSLHEVEDPADLQPGGRYAFLGSEAGYGRAMTLDEALEAGR